ncbi:MAG TPA: glycosyltransferase family 4 protein [Solirubrobacterales bacterium]|nr:glycosyltransferase family 4 protein [Solirubrobacterales bacterium]
MSAEPEGKSRHSGRSAIEELRVQVVDPPAYTPPYDRAVCAALAAAGADVELVTSRFGYGPVPHASGYKVTELFYRSAAGRSPTSRTTRTLKLAGHVPGMLRFRRHAAEADLVHFQWLTLPAVDARLLPRKPLVWTVHDPPPTGRTRSGWVAAARQMDALVAHSRSGADAIAERLEVAPERIHVIPHGPFDHLTRIADERPLPEELANTEGPVVLCFGLMRPYKGIDILLDAFREVDAAELWIVGRPMMDLAPLRELAARCRRPVRWIPRFITDPEIPALFRRADLVVLPYREADQSGVLYTALAFGNAVVATSVGGFPEVAAHGEALRLVPPGDAAALADALTELLADDAERRRLSAAARAAAEGPYSWAGIAEKTLALYREVLA